MRKIIITVLLLLLCGTAGFSQEEEETSLSELNAQLDNPLSRFWSMIFQENINFNAGDLIEGTAVSNVFNFQPSLPVPVGKAKMLLVRPVFPLITSPTFDDNGNKTGSETGFGDMQVFSLYGPDKKGGLIWGIGLSLFFLRLPQHI